MAAPQMVQCFGKKRNATAVAQCKAGQGLIKVNGRPLQLVEPAILRTKVRISCAKTTNSKGSMSGGRIQGRRHYGQEEDGLGA